MKFHFKLVSIAEQAGYESHYVGIPEDRFSRLLDFLNIIILLLLLLLLLL